MADPNVTSQKIVAPVQHKGRRGFLPIETNTFDRVFISVILFIDRKSTRLNSSH